MMAPLAEAIGQLRTHAAATDDDNIHRHLRSMKLIRHIRNHDAGLEEQRHPQKERGLRVKQDSANRVLAQTAAQRW